MPLLRLALSDRDVKFFRPLWIRVLVTAIVAAWFLAETLLGHELLWIGVTAAGLVYCIWNLFLRFPKQLPAGDTPAVPPPADPDPTKQP
jgi:hypothetical protein